MNIQEIKRTTIGYAYGLPVAVPAWFLALPTALHGLLALMALDILSGLVAAGKRKEINSDRSWIGMRKKAMMLLIVAACGVLSRVFGLPMELASAVAGVFCLTETISIVENAARMGVPLPKPLLDVLDKLKTMAEGTAKGTGGS